MKVEESYLLAHIDPEGDYLYRLWRATNIHTIHGHMASGHLQGRLLKMFVMMQKPRLVLEVGTFSGYSAICMAQGLMELDRSVATTQANPNDLSATHDGAKSQRRVYTFEINDEMEDFTRPWIEKSPVAKYIDFRIGDAVTEAPKLGVKFDMAFIDGDKRNYVETLDAIYPLMNAGAIIIADNTLWDGHVVDSAYDHDSQTVGIRRFNDSLAQDDRFEKVIVPVRDGLTIIRKRQ